MIIAKERAPIAADAGKVKTQAIRMFPATPQRTAERRLVAPTPMIVELITWVVETGIPNRAVLDRMAADVISTAKPLIGCSFTIFPPRVLMIRHPPADVPKAIIAAHENLTQKGT